ncbi:hypothetical protein CRUP_023584 [Coryphaenoides rupestris]|nr:hypothetical protein CRUP_023584 [Coryphaenoides rupestris]
MFQWPILPRNKSVTLTSALTNAGAARQKPISDSYVTNTTMLTGKARSQLMPRLLKKTVAPSSRTVSTTQWTRPRYRRVSLAPSICRRALITSMGVPRVQPAIPASPPASITPLHPGHDAQRCHPLTNGVVCEEVGGEGRPVPHHERQGPSVESQEPLLPDDPQQAVHGAPSADRNHVVALNSAPEVARGGRAVQCAGTPAAAKQKARLI